MEKIILEENNVLQLKSSILKVAHHGSKNSSSLAFVKAVSPTYSLISVGKGNTYGHPTEQTLDILTQINSKILRTDELGTIIMKMNGDMLEWKYER